MRKYFYILIFLAAVSAPRRANAQFTQVSGTVTDPNGIPYACGTISAQLVNNSGGSSTLNGGDLSGFTAPVKLGCPTDPQTSSTAGAFQMQLADNTVIRCGGATCSPQTQWRFTVNHTGIAPPAGTGPQSFSNTFTVSGASQVLTFTGVPALGRGPLGGIITDLITKNTPIIDVRAYGAVGDCVTDDRAAIQAAMDAAKPNKLAVFFPRIGPCYLTSTLTWDGVSLIGVQSGDGVSGLFRMPTQIRGRPSQDIFNVRDPILAGATVPNFGYTIANIDFVVDDSVDASASFPFRKVGRTVVDGSITSGTAVLTSTTAQFVQGDVGQAITVSGAGVAGATLTTTIASVPRVGNGFATTATLSVNASTTVSNATVYVSLAGLSATETVGNCALGWDNRDANTTNWTVSYGNNPGNANAVWRDVSIYSLSGAIQNHSCAIFLQGQAGQTYGSEYNPFNISRTVFGFIYAPSSINPASGPLGGDHNHWAHGNLSATYPFIFYNGGFNKIEDYHVLNGRGIHVVSAFSTTETYSSRWIINIPEFEVGSGVAARIGGLEHYVYNTNLTGGNNTTAIWDAGNSYCVDCVASVTGSTLNVNGNLNSIDLVDGIDNTTVNNIGFDNEIIGRRVFNPIGGTQPPRSTALSPQRIGGPTKGSNSAFIMRGLAGTSYFNENDLWLWPGDIVWGGGNGQYTKTADTNSESGYYVAMTTVAGDFSNVFPLFGGSGFATSVHGQMLIGKQIPAANVTVYVKAKCPVLATYPFSVTVLNPAGATVTTFGNFTFNCAASYSVSQADINLSTYAGNHLQFSIFTGEVDLAWLAFRPWNGDLPTAGGVKFAGGTTLARYSRFAVSQSPGAVAANTCAAQSLTVTGIAAADILISVAKPTEQAGLSLTPGHVTGVNTVTVNFCNNTAGAITPTAAETYQFVVVQ